ncbi:polysaccharide deacetylase family protein [Planktothrix sp. FACHB-1355]|uniref:Polysaccharide deacetylase family protein n=1 Tax=Aerosakkonema funiforme FACHB-1375 TaxID=2949571 RepID=A0A926ZEV9_9CYAN|nr:MULTISPECIES: polysaccharide deacetylase family protein [Oscillatoriales]MBD2180170.1 polysaccharide deacetylase family protein [Aerosakkonema funiforme FACHB-1375]MBD3559759.1 polysaccharide deacetylase family protein [Planktothrix sp. FACHB-1355]
MKSRYAFFWYPRFFPTLVTVVGLLGSYMALPGRLSDSRLPSFGMAHPVKATNLVFSVPTQYQGKTVRKVDLGTPEKVIALTFDDGPWPKTTLQVLEILRKNNIKATFFWIGRNLKNYPDIGRRVVQDGHVIGNHTWHHWYFHMNPAVAAAEIENTAALIYKTTGVKTSLFRPPGGFLNNGLAAYARSQKYAIVMWSDDPGENHIGRSAPVLANNVLKAARPGEIILLHDIHPRTVQALPIIIAGLKQRGYRFVTVPQLLAMQKRAQNPKTEPPKAAN